jgi:hypothetical protein
MIGFIVRGTHLFQPVNTNSWREADVSTIAKNFYLNGTDIFHPQIAYDGNGPGYVESEFQIYTYLIALTYKIFGFWEQTGRIISFLASLAAMLVFFRFSRYLLDSKTAIASSLFFAISPLLMAISVGIQPESLMFFFYVCSAYTFVRWLDSNSKKFYWLAILFTALALLCKITAANIGIFFLLMIITRNGWKFLYKPKVLILGALSIIPSILWYSYCHKFYVLYGNSLGISNENPWIGWDFFTNHSFIFGLIENELLNVWTRSGPFIIILALLFTKLIKKDSFLLGLFWYTSVSVFYIITSRTTASSWAWYYHIFSIPSVAILLGSSVVELYNTHFPNLNFRKKIALSKPAINKSSAISLILILAASFFLLSCYIYLVKTKPAIYQTSKFYAYKDTLKELIPKNSLILANGGPSKDVLGYSLAVEIGYFYYWLECKGYSISEENLSLKNIEAFKKKGVDYFVAEDYKIRLVPGLEDELKKNLKVIYECNGCTLFKL